VPTRGGLKTPLTEWLRRVGTWVSREGEKQVAIYVAQDLRAVRLPDSPGLPNELRVVFADDGDPAGGWLRLSPGGDVVSGTPAVRLTADVWASIWRQGLEIEAKWECGQPVGAVPVRNEDEYRRMLERILVLAEWWREEQIAGTLAGAGAAGVNAVSAAPKGTVVTSGEGG